MFKELIRYERNLHLLPYHQYTPEYVLKISIIKRNYMGPVLLLLLLMTIVMGVQQQWQSDTRENA
jgi:hypothetical protein